MDGTVLQAIQAIVAEGDVPAAQAVARIVDQFWEALGLAAEPAPGDAAVLASVEAAVYDALDALDAAAVGWSAPNDNDRLRSAFLELEAAGLVAFGPAGWTQEEARAIAADRAVTLDQRGLAPIRGYVTFHRQDVWTALGGGGLHLAFGAFEDGGGGEIGESAVAALGRAGLAAAWDGAVARRILVPAFRWRTRLPRATDADVASFLEGWALELQAPRRGEGPPEGTRLALHAEAWFAGVADLGGRLLGRLGEAAGRAAADLRSAEQRWSERTDNDRLTAAFAELRAGGVVALEGAGATLQDAWGTVGLHARPGDRGAVVYHAEDVVDAVAGQGLRLGFAAFEPAGTARLGEELVSLLRAHGLRARWSGAIHDRILLAPFVWRRRQFTAAPVAATTPPVPPDPDAVSLDPVACASLRRRLLEGGHAELVEAPIAVGWDLPRTRRLRAAFDALGSGLPAHACHVGDPYVFVPAGRHVLLGAMPAQLNLTDEIVPLVERGRAARDRAAR